MKNYLYSQKSSLFYRDKEELNWLENKQFSETENNSFIKNQIEKWEFNLDKFLNDSFGSRNFDLNLDYNQKEVDSFLFHLNIKRFVDFDWSNLELWKIQLLKEVDNYLSKHIFIKDKRIAIQFIGSIGSNDPIFFSDFDCIIILPDLSIWTKNDLKKLRRFINTVNYYTHLFDPLQRHDAFIISEFEILFNDSEFYPINLLKNNWGYGKDQIPYPKNKKLKSNPFIFINSVQLLRRRKFNKESINSMYSLKFLLSIIYMLPVYYYNVKGDFLDKKNAINKIKSESDKFEEIIDWLSSFRKNWPSSNRSTLKKTIFFLGISFFSTQKLNLLYRRILFYTQNSRIEINYFEEIIERSNILADCLLDSLMED